ncbi:MULTISPECIES: efflux RND transporter periplasmic adaptor subunit [unclassified Cupriavidus]|uniref:efflux RND transporter periplasmic adaptor subunit n=1 Tax=unclassified Cupriavidus TaxID=2640874 RepID=UPI001C007E0F|nr:MULTISPECIES: efflux RND transporter periplasmic adaptor subunit [unclassified Cupriavidus]MCA3187504.1 efflux RND transporter periplasmic adaptor subunit [Cupriavidus sp.]MCA3188476.1 efflux RND transporter periplasmic adaptor subunit [Cupriavidus sp.]MCA3199466.1 efflux RND transporter periplasmic adaptor subunit [Cupriavidus sp.]MCA3204515.1 efflux RND transporter periplasmic adaptor subunit [Cupriavidus sp.]MCA3206027.1 efflux RND transporter periplasmic adaptor subunit [Cupriavidus sp.
MRRALNFPSLFGRFRMAAVVSLCALALAGCGKKEVAEPDDDPKISGQTITYPAGVKALPGVVGQPVQSGGDRMLSMPGRLVWNEDKTVRVATPFVGRVMEIMVQPGSTVKAGQALAMLTSPDFGVAQADARKAAADSAVAAKSLARQRELYQAGVIAQKDLEQSQADNARAAADLARTQAALRMYGAGGGDAVNQRFALRSPIDGLVVERNINPGMEVRPDQQPNAPLFLITDPSTLWASLDAAEADLGLFKPGINVQLTSAAYPGETFTGTVVKIADYVDPASRSVKVRLAVPNADRRLKAEMFVTAKVQAASFQGIAVPSKAVFLADNRNYVFVRTSAAPFVFERREVKLGVSLPGTTEVVSGLKAGDVVITDGNLYLQDILRDATAVNAARAGAK